MILHHTWNDGMLENWNVGFQKEIFLFIFMNIFQFPIKIKVDNTQLLHFPEPIIPSFQTGDPTLGWGLLSLRRPL